MPPNRAGKQVGTVASEELDNLRADLDDLISRIPSLSDVDLEKAKEKLMAKNCVHQGSGADVAHDAREQFDYGVECSRELRERNIRCNRWVMPPRIGFLIGLLTSRR